MATYRKVEEYKEDEEWVEYVERLTHYFTANEIEDEGKQRSILLSVCGAKTYKFIRNLVAAEKPDSKSFKELAEIVQRFKFNSRFRKEGESISTYVAELRQLTEHCNFGTALEDMLRDRLVCGINEDRIQRRLLSETTLNFKKAYEIAVGMEIAAKNAKDIQQAALSLEGNQIPTQQNVNKVSENVKLQGRNDWSAMECYRCGGKHKSEDCKFKEDECYYCHKKGHIAKKCKAKRRDNNANKSREDQQTTEARKYHQTTNYLDEDQDLLRSYSMYTVGASKSKPYCVNIKVNGQDVKMEVDTGASVTVINEQTFRQTLKSTPKIQPSDGNLHTYTGEEIKVVGEIQVLVKYNNQKEILQAIVVAGKAPNLLGRNWLEKVKLNWQEVFSTTSSSTHENQDSDNASINDKNLSELLEKYSQVFEEGLGTLKATKAKIVVEGKDKIEKELKRLENEGP